MLRGINVSGQKKILMKYLAEMFKFLGFKKVTTYIQSGNVIFGSSNNNVGELENGINLKMKETFGFDVPVMIRTYDTFKQVVSKLPFTNVDFTKVYVTFFSTKLQTKVSNEITGVKAENELFAISGREVYLYCPNGYGTTKLNNNFFERKLKVIATTRNWKTVNKLLDMAKPGLENL